MTRREAAVDLHLVARGALQSAHEQSRAVARRLEKEAEAEGEEGKGRGRERRSGADGAEESKFSRRVRI